MRRAASILFCVMAFACNTLAGNVVVNVPWPIISRASTSSQTTWTDTNSANLVGMWCLSTNGNNWADESGNAYIATNTGSVVRNVIWTNQYGVVQRAWTMDNANDRFVLPDVDAFEFTSGGGNDLPFTVIIWHYVPAGAVDYLVTKDNVAGARAWSIYWGAAGGNQITFIVLTDVTKYIGRRYTTAATGNTWQGIACIYDGSKASTGIDIMLNGKVVDNTDQNTGVYAGMANTTVPVVIGDSFNNAAPASGKIYMVRIYNAALSSAACSNILYWTPPLTNMVLSGTSMRPYTGGNVEDTSGY